MDKHDVKILALDDEEVILDTLQKRLVKEGYNVTTFTDGNKAIDFCINQEVQLALSDIKMPAMDGITFLEKLKDTSPFTEVIMLTAYSSLGKMSSCMRKGAFAFVEKPFNTGNLLFLVEKAIEHSVLRRDLMNRVMGITGKGESGH